MPKVVLIGASGQGRVVAELLRKTRTAEVLGFLDDGEKGGHFVGLPLLGKTSDLSRIPSDALVIITIGDNVTREKLAARAVRDGRKLFTAVHPSAVIADDCSIGSGTVIMAGAIIQSGSRIGKNVIVNTAASVDHDCEIGDGAHICPGARLAGGVRVGRRAWIGIGASVIQYLDIGDDALVGAGAAVVRNVAASKRVLGVPARSL